MLGKASAADSCLLVVSLDLYDLNSGLILCRM